MRKRRRDKQVYGESKCYFCEEICVLEMNMKVKDKFVRYEVATLSNYMHENLKQSIYKNFIKINK
jgi:hypothetical protein